ncbi:MAG: SUMF1/EgtB/PvdO family nonheme iron enzyme [Prevotellaceae bacterium]|nr:SUMF1/EgtB/PvdO family nonheme iron enzyme [Prevotellaceae bacterium]
MVTKRNVKRRKYKRWIFLSGFILGFLIVFLFNEVITYTSTDEYCMSCHIHPDADETWKQSVHHNTKSGVTVHCVDCHLPPKGSFRHLCVKGKTGITDLWRYWTKDSASFNWEQKRRMEHAVKIVYNESCEDCHKTLYTKNISSEGAISHLYYEENKEKLNLQCIGCHLDAGHYNANYAHKNELFGNESDKTREIFDSATKITGFENFTEKIPGTPVSFNMIAIQGGTFSMGSQAKESYRNEDEGPVREVTVSPFYMAEVEVTWDAFLTFRFETQSEGRVDQSIIKARNLQPDAISGPTPPYGQPDQGWGYGNNPAITMSYYAAEIYCKWLSMKTGKKYRLPTEAEWEYAARGNTTTPYYFAGNPKKYTRDRWWNSVFGVDTAVINSYIIYQENSNGRTYSGDRVMANPFGLKNMLGNVMEYCSDWYSPTAYSETLEKVTDPKGPESGEEHVVRGGSYSSDAKDVRVASRDYSRTNEWLKTDPQSPKSLWWLSDCTKIGFRVVCETEN